MFQSFMLFAGHARHRGGQSWFDCVGRDLGSRQLGEWLDRIDTDHVSLILSPCQTEAFIWHASRPGRVVITSTRQDEDNYAGVAEAAIRGLSLGDRDLDGDGRFSMFEAYQAIVDAQVKEHASRDRLPEHALLDDDGDGEGHYLPIESDAGGERAKGVFLRDEGRPLVSSRAALEALHGPGRRATTGSAAHR